MKQHTVTLREFIEWRDAEEVTFASSSRENKRLLCTLDDWIVVRHAGIEIVKTKMFLEAVKAYNNITDKYISPTINFKL